MPWVIYRYRWSFLMKQLQPVDVKPKAELGKKRKKGGKEEEGQVKKKQRRNLVDEVSGHLNDVSFLSSSSWISLSLQRDTFWMKETTSMQWHSTKLISLEDRLEWTHSMSFRSSNTTPNPTLGMSSLVGEEVTWFFYILFFAFLHFSFSSI